MKMSAPRWILLGLCACLPQTAFAQSAIALDRFEPPPPGSRLFAIADPTVTGALTPTAGLVLTYADSPLVLALDRPKTGETSPVVKHQFILHVQAALQLARRFELAVDVPLILDQGGDSPTRSGVTYGSPSGAAMGDLRVTGRVSVLQQKHLRPAVGVLGSTWFPSGNDSAYSGAGQFRFGLDLLLGLDVGPMVLRSALGRRHQADDALLPTGGSGWAFSCGGAYRFGGWQIGPEFYLSTATESQFAAFTSRSTNAEALLGFRFHWSSLIFGAALGPGLSNAPGTPSYRGLLGVAYAPESNRESTPRTDLGSPAVEEARADARSHAPQPVGLGSAGTAAGQTPPSSPMDGDSDGIADMDDACPAQSGQANANPRLNGCPVDTDHDGIADMDDACPNVAGEPNNESSRHGCPADRDGDGVPDPLDACPDISGEASPDPKLHGCRTSIVIRGSQLVLAHQVHFKTGSDEILSDSHELLLQLKQALTDRADIARVAVDGHTDNVGNENKNLALSRRRALAVVRWLVQNGIDERRLEARGFGPKQPLLPNTSEDARAKNRRVEFIILRSTELGQRGWKDGPVNE